MPFGGVKKKKKGGGAAKRAEERKVNSKTVKKVVEDKTFGMKNKNKSKRVQKQIKQIQNQGGMGKKAKEEKKRAEKAEKARLKAERAKQLQINQNLKVFGNKEGKGKRKECPYFLKGTCRQGKKCLFAHDNGGKLSLYEDARDTKEDDMTNWDQETLEAAVKRKDFRHANQTNIICKYFLDAIESRKYGHFWKCENGLKCIYRHKLPPGFVLKSKKTAAEMMEEGDGPDVIAEKIEEERAKLDLTTCTPLTLELFTEWLVKRKAARDAEIEAERKKNEKKTSRNQSSRILSGRALFEFDPSLFQDEAGAAGASEMTVEDEAPTEEKEPLGEETEEPANIQAAVAAEGAAQAGAPLKKKKKKVRKKKKKGAAAAAAAAAAAPAPAPAAAPAAAAPAVQVDASLFMDDEVLPDSDED